MGELVLVRHGQASFGAADYDVLSPLGHQQAEWLGGYFQAHNLRFDRVLHGSLRRQRETAAGIARVLALPTAEVDARFDEFHYQVLEEAYLRETGANTSTHRGEFLERFPQVISAWEQDQVAGEETLAAFEARVADACAAALRPGQSTLAVTSGGVIGMVMRRVLGLSAVATAEVMLGIHNASVHRFSLEAGKLRLSLFNASPHLDPTERAHARTYV